MESDRNRWVVRLVRGFADVMLASKLDQQRQLAAHWCLECDDFFDEYADQNASSLATYIARAFEESPDPGGAADPQVHARVLADIYAVRAIAGGSGEE